MKATKDKSTKTLLDLFLGELSDMYDAEHRIAKALPKMEKFANQAELKQAVILHLQETKDQILKIEEVFGLFDKKPKRKTCKATLGLLEEADDIAGDFKDTPPIDAALISAMQKVEHYEIASYGCLHAWALLLENKQAADLIASILKEETAANDKLSELAASQCNESALGIPTRSGSVNSSSNTQPNSPKKKVAASKRASA